MSRHGFSIPSWGRRWRRRWAAPSGTLRIARPPVSCMRTGRQRPAGDGWVLARLREAGRAALETGAPQAAAGLLARALAEPPPPDQRVECLREAARAEVTAARETAYASAGTAWRSPRSRRSYLWASCRRGQSAAARVTSRRVSTWPPGH